LVARGLVNVGSRRWQAVLIGLILVGATVSIGTYYTGHSQEDWRGIATRLDGATESDDLLVVQPTWIENNLDYYAEALPDHRYALRARGSVTPGGLETLTTRAQRHHVVWLVTYDSQASEAVSRRLQDSHTLVDRFTSGAITVYRFERRPTGNA
jgi:hypothetical protein